MERRKDRLSSKELLQRIGLGDVPADPSPQRLPDTTEPDFGTALLERHRLMQTAHRFQPGDLVRWKPGLANRRFPRYGSPAVVVEVLDPPIIDGDDESGSPYFREPLSLVIGLIWTPKGGRDGFVTFHVDARRFEPWSGA